MSSLGLSNSKEVVLSYLEESFYGKKPIGYSEKLCITFEEREMTYRVEFWLETNMYFAFSPKI